MSATVESLTNDLRMEIESSIEIHASKRDLDAVMHQGLVIAATLAGIASFAAGVLFQSAPWAGIIGGLTSVATVLSQQLYCVKAENWQARMVIELEGIRHKLIYEHQLAPTANSLAALSQELKELKSRMADDWEKATSLQPAMLGVLTGAARRTRART